MGNIYSLTIQDIMDFEDTDVDTDVDATEDEEFFDTFQDDILGENYLILILRQLIQSRELQLINSNDEDHHICKMKLPTIRRKPNLDALKKSSIYQSIKQASGFKADGSDPEENWCVLKMLANRQSGIGPKLGPFTQYDKCKINNMFVPNKREKTMANLGTKVFCGTYSRDGNYFITASQDQKLRIFDATSTNYKLISKITAKDVSWCVLDIDFSPDGQYFVYSTWSDCLHISKAPLDVQSASRNSSEDLQCLLLRPESSRFCIFSVAFSNCGKELIGGANDGCLYIYDRVLERRTLKCPVSDNHDDVNAVGFVDETSNIFFSGGEDSIIKVWDRRTLNEAKAEPVGKLIGHYDGITYINPRNDGRHLISNSKDQSIKLWDLRSFSPSGKEKVVRNFTKQNSWDYRWDPVPKIFYSAGKPMDGDTSVMTYRGHRVQKSLIRAKFSPALTTGQRFIYTGCSTGRVIIYDVLTGKMVSAIEGHSDMVRDVAWHPKRPEILSCAWDYNVNLNTYIDNTRPEKRNILEDSFDSSDPPLRRSRRIALRQKLSNSN